MSAQFSIADYSMQSLQIALGLVFLAAALSKIRAPQTFVSIVEMYEILPKAVTRVAAFLIIVLETLVALGFLSSIALLPAAGVALVALVTFAIAVGYSLRKGRAIACGCFGAPEESVSSRSLVRLGMLTAAAALVLWLGMGRATPISLAAVHWNDGADLEYLFEVLLTTSFLLIVGSWCLRSKELRSLLMRGSSSEATGVK